MEDAFEQTLIKHCNSNLFKNSALNKEINETEVRFGVFNENTNQRSKNKYRFSPGIDVDKFRKIIVYCTSAYSPTNTTVLKISVNKNNMNGIHKLDDLINKKPELFREININNMNKEERKIALAIYSEYSSSYRVEISNLEEIKRFCTSDILDITSPNVSVCVKTKVNTTDIVDYGLRVASSTECVRITNNSILEKIRTKLSAGSMITGDTSKWQKHNYRYMQRHSFNYDDNLRIDLSIVKTGDGHNFYGSGVLNSIEQHHVELEYLREPTTSTSDDDWPTKYAKTLNNAYKPIIEKFLEIIADGGEIMSKTETDNILNQYKNLARTRVPSFVAPAINALTLDVLTNKIDKILGAGEDTREGAEETKEPIESELCFTSKLDGERQLLYISDDSSVYLINNKMSFYKLPGKLGESLKNSLFDGEFIKTENSGNYFYVFDILFHNKLDQRNEDFKKRYELYNELLNNDIKLDITHINPKQFFDYTKMTETFADGDIPLNKLVVNSSDKSDRSGRDDRNSNINYKLTGENGFNLDGLIIQFWKGDKSRYPTLTASNANRTFRWDNVWKWKPIANITFDFKLTKPLYNPDSIDSRSHYKTFEIRYSSYAGKDRYGKPIFDDVVFKGKDRGYIRIPIKAGKPPRTTNGIIKENSICECAWENKWVVKRIRYDKTHPNGEKVIASNWELINTPIYLDYLENPGQIKEYSKNGVVNLMNDMTKHHNNIKKNIIDSLMNKKGLNLLDLGSGPLKDQWKWQPHILSGKLKSVIAVDTQLKDAEERLIRMTRRLSEADATKIRQAISIYPRDFTKNIDINVYSLSSKFDVVTAFFSMHYAFSNTESIESFFYNVSNNLSVGGKFAATLFDKAKVLELFNTDKDKLGENVFKYIKKPQSKPIISRRRTTATPVASDTNTEDTVITIYGTNPTRHITWMISKFENDDSRILVNVSTIGYHHQEYLVDFNSIDDILLKYKLKITSSEPFISNSLSGSHKIFSELNKTVIMERFQGSFEEPINRDTDRDSETKIKAIPEPNTSTLYDRIKTGTVKRSNMPVKPQTRTRTRTRAVVGRSRRR